MPNIFCPHIIHPALAAEGLLFSVAMDGMGWMDGMYVCIFKN
jgi:hypothetical protein